MIQMPVEHDNYKSYRLSWCELPGHLTEEIEVFAIGDVHGQADLLEKVLLDIRSTPRTSKSRHLVFLGDLIDRGPESIRAVELAMQSRQLADAEYLHVLPGNHDIALVLGLSSPSLLSYWISGGGNTVLSELGLSEGQHSLAEITDKLQEVLHPGYLETIENGPSHLYLNDLLFVHAGVHPYGDITEFLEQERFFINVDDHWATMRQPFLSHRDGWDSRDADPERRRLRPTVIVHGHTPVLRRDIASDEDLNVCDRIESHRTVALDIGAAIRSQLAFGHIRSFDGQAKIQIRAVKKSPAV